jgi:hypothetical protein
MRKYLYLREKSKQRGLRKQIATLEARAYKAKGLKWCPSCQKAKEFSCFSTRRWGDGLASHCKECSNAYAQKHPEWDKKNYQKHKDRWVRRKLAKFGISLERYHEMHIQQNGQCAICGAEESKNGKRLAVDHSHLTNQIRGLLCNNCNVALGFLQDNPTLARKCADYLERWREQWATPT